MLARRPDTILRLLDLEVDVNRLLIAATENVLAIINGVFGVGLSATDNHQPSLYSNWVDSGVRGRIIGSRPIRPRLVGHAHLHNHTEHPCTKRQNPDQEAQR